MYKDKDYNVIWFTESCLDNTLLPLGESSHPLASSVTVISDLAASIFTLARFLCLFRNDTTRYESAKAR